MTTLISFLGKGKDDINTGYRNGKYDFGNGSIHCVPYFGLALHEHLKPDRLILVGTAGSMWDVFFLNQQDSNDNSLDNALINAVYNQCVTEDMLTPQQQRLTEKLATPVECLLIPFACTVEEQVAVLTRLASTVAEKETICLDVTHGFRHLPMLAMVAARYLTHVADANISGIYYGAMEMTKPDGLTPVLRLDGMLQMLDWVDALATYKKDGDYGAFEKLLIKDGLPDDKGNELGRAAYFERTNNLLEARKRLTGIFSAVESHTGSLAKLFQETLKDRINWFRRQTRHEWELSLADAYLSRGDYLRATIFLYEAFVSSAAYDRKLATDDYKQREEAWQEAKASKPLAKKLEYLRNALSHGIKSDDREIAAIVADEQRLVKKLEEFRKKLFP